MIRISVDQFAHEIESMRPDAIYYDSSYLPGHKISQCNVIRGWFSKIGIMRNPDIITIEKETCSVFFCDVKYLWKYEYEGIRRIKYYIICPDKSSGEIVSHVVLVDF